MGVVSFFMMWVQSLRDLGVVLLWCVMVWPVPAEVALLQHSAGGGGWSQPFFHPASKPDLV